MDSVVLLLFFIIFFYFSLFSLLLFFRIKISAYNPPFQKVHYIFFNSTTAFLAIMPDPCDSRRQFTYGWHFAKPRFGFISGWLFWSRHLTAFTSSFKSTISINILDWVEMQSARAQNWKFASCLHCFCAV